MPRVSIDTTDESPKRAPRKRAVRRVVTTSEVPAVRKPRIARAVKIKIDENAGDVSAVSSPRRAPTQITVRRTNGTSKKYAVVLSAMTLLIAGAAWIGFSDVGQIDVTARINEQNQKKSLVTQETEQTTGENVTVPVQNTPPAAISNIRPRSDTPPPEASLPEVATTTTETASSTETVTEGEVSEEQSDATEATEAAVSETENTTPVIGL